MSFLKGGIHFKLATRQNKQAKAETPRLVIAGLKVLRCLMLASCMLCDNRRVAIAQVYGSTARRMVKELRQR